MTDEEILRKCAEWVGMIEPGASFLWTGKSEADLAEAVRLKLLALEEDAPIWALLATWGRGTPIENIRAAMEVLS